MTNKYIFSVFYLIVSIPIFFKVYNTSVEVIDEEFHLRQAKQYCLGNFHVWDKKITTFPGLYLLSCVVLPFKFCTTFYLRLIILLASALNLFILSTIVELRKGKSSVSCISAVNIALLPPMYFFAHLYYTDVVSITAILALYYFWLESSHKLGALFGIVSILMRQTNVIWVAMLFGESCIDQIMKNRKRDIKQWKNVNEIMQLFLIIKMLLTSPKKLWQEIKNIFNQLWPYIVVIFGFVIFVFLNGSIVVGDKSAHVATIHLPQIFYFSIFVGVFGFSILLPHFKSTLRIISNNKFIFISIIFVFVVIVKYNTLEHPYLLADNRHYTFYIWSRFYSKYSFFRYLMVPVYLFCLVLIVKCLENKSLSFRVMFTLSTLLVLTLQSLLELRYFLVPYIFLRLNTKTSNKFLLGLEFVIYFVFNCITFYIFFTKEIHWDNFESVQRLIW